MHVVKFGGSCLGERSDLDHVASRIEDFSDDVVVVLSAIRGVTDELVRILYAAEDPGLSDPDRAAFVEGLRARHLAFSPSLGEDPDLNQEFDDLLSQVDRDLTILTTMGSDGNSSVSTRVLVAGERAAILAVAADLRARGIDVEPVRSEDAGIQLRVSEAMAKIELEATRSTLSLPSDSIPLCTGWYGVDENGDLALLGRGGSDCTATALASILRAESITIWRDTPGVLALDPSWRLPGRRLGYLSYPEALQLASTSGSLLHPDAIEPLLDLGIPLYVRPLRSASEPGTLIGPSIVTDPPRIRAMACRRGLHEVLWKVRGGSGLARTLAALSRSLHEHRVRVWSLSGDSSGIRVLVDEKDVIRIGSTIRRFDAAAAIEPSPPLALLSFIGEGIGDSDDVKASIHDAAEEAGIKLRALGGDLPQHGMDVLLSASDVKRAVPTLTEAFGLLEA